jgi:RNA polymerase sigma-70 factor (ECF subfamily)
MKADESTPGGGRAFPETTMGFAGGLARPGTPDWTRSMETLCTRYWKPVYTWLRLAWAKGPEDARDLTQAFFAELLENPALARFDPAKGGFRPYLKTLLRRFAAKDLRDRLRLKRGGGAAPLRLDGSVAEPADPTADPEQAFERVWLEELVRQSVEAARASCSPERFRVYEAYTASEPPPSYDELARALGATKSEVEKALFLVREEIRRGVRERLRESSGEGAEDDWRRILGG